MSTPPKLKIKLPRSNPDEYIYTLEEAGNVLDFSEGVFTVEGQWIHSYNELANLVKQDRFKGKDFIEIEWIQMMGGG